MSVSQEILDWSQTRPAWQRDAMRRFVTHQSFSDADLDEVLTILKEANDLPVAKVVAPRPLEEKHLKQEGGAGGPVQLASLGDVENAKRT